MNSLHRILALLVACSLLLGACSLPTSAQPSVDPTFTPVPTETITPTATLAPTETPVPTQTPGPTDDVWQRVNKNHKLVVGVPLDNPPFASLSPLYQIDGLDVALAQEIGKRLNLPVEIQPLAPVSLAPALLLNQIDLALGGIPNTQNFDNQLWFSSSYYTDQTAAIARKLAPIPNLTDFTQLAQYRVGVETGSVFEKMAQTYLVDSGLMPKAHLYHYTYADQAAQDLSASRIDVLLTGKTQAGYFTLADNTLHPVAQGFAELDLAPAMRANLDGMKPRIDLILKQMQTDGTLDGLTRKYVHVTSFGDLPAAAPLSQIAVTPAPAPTDNPSAAAACFDGLQFILDETNGAVDWAAPPRVKSTKLFTQTWKVINTGTCDWTPQYHLVLTYKSADGADMGGVAKPITSPVKAGDTTSLSVQFTAPVNAGVYESFWQLQNAQGQVFGQALWTGIKDLKTKNQVAGGGLPSQPKQTSCVVVNNGPVHDVHVRDNFDVTWLVTNVSGITWKAANVVYVYASGTKMQKQDSYDIANDIVSTTAKNASADGQYTFAVDMNAPATPGIYSVTWNVMWDKKILCTMVANVTILPRQ